MTEKSQSLMIAEAKVAAVEQHLAELASARKELDAHIQYLTSRTERQAFKVRRQDPDALADQARTDAELADARTELADINERQQAIAGDLVSRKHEVEAVKTAEMVRARDEAERAGVAALVDVDEFAVRLEMAHRIYERQRAKVNELQRWLATRKVLAPQHMEIPVRSAGETHALFLDKLAELDAKLADPGQYDYHRFLPQTAPVVSAPAKPKPGPGAVMSLAEFHASFSND